MPVISPGSASCPEHPPSPTSLPTAPALPVYGVLGPSPSSATKAQKGTFSPFSPCTNNRMADQECHSFSVLKASIPTGCWGQAGGTFFHWR